MSPTAAGSERVVRWTPEQTLHLVLSTVAVAPQHDVVSATESVVVVRRRYNPAWAVAAAVLLAVPTGFVSLLLLLIRTSETFTITVQPQGPGAHVAFYGEVSRRMRGWLDQALEETDTARP